MELFRYGYGRFSRSCILQLLIVYTIFGSIGLVNVYVALMVPGLSGGIGSTNFIQASAGGRIQAGRNRIGTMFRSPDTNPMKSIGEIKYIPPKANLGDVDRVAFRRSRFMK